MATSTARPTFRHGNWRTSVADVELESTTRPVYWPKWLALLAVAGASVIGARWTLTAIADSYGYWVQVARDSSYDIAIDTSRIKRRGEGWEIWYRTDHATTHLYKDKAFNREVVQSLLRCSNLSFRVARVDMSLRPRGVVAQQLAGPGELGQQPWRPVDRETIEGTAAKAACDFVDRRVRR